MAIGLVHPASALLLLPSPDRLQDEGGSDSTALASPLNHLTGGLSVTRRHWQPVGQDTRNYFRHGFCESVWLSDRRPHYHTITRTKQVNVPMPVPVPPPPAQVITHVQNMPIHVSWPAVCWLDGAQDAPQVIKVPTPGAPMWHLGLMTYGLLTVFPLLRSCTCVVLKRCPSTSTRSTSCPCQSQARLSTTLCQCP